ncbi:MAG TPA: hypothetical protein VMZ53_23660 [Kofleriaceae bacterium]|nr:hypothetical protein [Kofleriaceae bacterium]
MSYLHCPTCKRAYNVAISTQCPSCPVPVQLVDAAEDIVAAAEALARAMQRATPDERDDAMGRMDRLALPAPGAKPVTFQGAMLRSIREALDPPPAAHKPQPLVATIARALIERVVDHPRAIEMRERLARRAPRLREGWRRVRALASAAAN